MWSVARKSTIPGTISRIAQRTTSVVRPVVLVPGQQLNHRRQYNNNAGDAKAEKVSI